MSPFPEIMMAVAVAIIPAGAIFFTWYGLLHFVSVRFLVKPQETVPLTFYKCSFCGRSHAEVGKLIAGPSVNICDKCILVCNNLLDPKNKNESPD